ncbi:uncharacterized protein LOC119559696 [Drosophila subpulchrella]|uniref:uncharacterized protein LOC119559696 n=1 Tax=Drosophila subpulchrella TaxID=1486046 RepID=UPI0018A168A0|nr:uncharacterized protein LOC119559696 [Drosophila subpulchrella]
MWRTTEPTREQLSEQKRPEQPQHQRGGEVAAADSRLDVAGGTCGGDGGGGGAPNLGGERSPGEPTGPQDPRQTGALGPTDTGTGPRTPSTGPATPAPAETESATAASDPDEPLERGPWVWPEPVDGGRPPLKRQHSAPEVSEVVARPKLSRTVSAPGGQRWRAIEEHEWPEGIAETPAVREARILGGRGSVRIRRDGRAFRVTLGVAGTRVFEEQPK